MKLVIQIPCFNEAETLPATLEDLPRSLPGIDVIEILVIDDGSTDGTAAIASRLGVHKVVRLPTNQGLATAFARGLIEASRMDADIVVNTDADLQYPGRCIAGLIQPVLEGNADIVVGCRPIDRIAHFTATKKRLQTLGSRAVMWLTDLDVPDVTSGFRAYSKQAIRHLKVFSEFTYTIETLIQAAKSGLRVVSVPADINPPTRQSRLFRNNWYYIRRQIVTIFRIWALYSPGKLFNRAGLTSLSLGSLLVLRFLIYYIALFPEPSGKIQSLVVASVLLSLGFSLLLFGVVTDLIRVNRKLLEETIDRLDSIARQNHHSEE